MADGRGGARQGAGRPAGSKNKVTEQSRRTIADLASAYTDDALAALVKIMRDGQSESARVSAANAVLDRAYGKPVQALDHGGSIDSKTTLDVTKLDVAQRKALLAAVILEDDELSPDEG